jgi:hypothetical protein
MKVFCFGFLKKSTHHMPLMNDQKYFVMIWLIYSGKEKLSSDYTTEMYNFPHKILGKGMPFCYTKCGQTKLSVGYTWKV